MSSTSCPIGACSESAVDDHQSFKVPLDLNFDVMDSSFFQRFDRLPSLDEVRSQARALHLAGAKWRGKPRPVFDTYNINPSPAVFESMGLFVKWGSGVNIAEGQSLYAIRRQFSDTIPVPEVYGWRTDGDEAFVYMEAVDGQTLEDAWGAMETNDRLHVCHELRAMMDILRQWRQHYTDVFIGNIAGGLLHDRAINPRYMPEAGPFQSVKEFNDWFTFLHKRPMPDPSLAPMEPFRQDIPDDSDILFTHGDLHPSNIIVSKLSPHRVVAIIDWEQSGWLPAYWEARKAQWTSECFSEWSKKYLPIILDQYKDTLEPWDYYTISMGC